MSAGGLLGTARQSTVRRLDVRTPSSTSGFSSQSSAINLQERGRPGSAERALVTTAPPLRQAALPPATMLSRFTGGATFGFEASETLSLARLSLMFVRAALLSAHFIQNCSTARTHAEIWGRRQCMMSRSSAQAPIGTVCFGKTLNFETTCSTPIRTDKL